MNALLPDTRPFPTDPVKNDLLMYANQMAQNPNNAQGKLAGEQLRNQIATMLFERHILGLSVAMSMAANPAAYQQLWLSLNEVLTAQNDSEVQWLALPVILVAGSKQPMALDNSAPVAALQAFFAQYGEKSRAILNALLDQYREHGPEQLVIPTALQVPPVAQYGNVMEIAALFGGALLLKQAVDRLQNLIYAM